MLDGNNFLTAGWVHGMKLHSFGTAEDSKFVIMGKVAI